MPRVAILTFGLSGGGAQAVCRAWARGLHALGFRVTVVVLDNVQSGTLEHPLPDAIEIVEAYPATGSGAIRRLRWLRELLADRQFDVLLSLETYPNLLALLASRSMPCTQVVVSEHNVPSILLSAEGFSKRIQMTLARRLYRYAAITIAVSHAVATDLRVNYGVPGDRLAVLTNPVVEGPDNRLVVRSRSESGLRIVVPARWVPQKRPNMAIAIVKELVARGHDAELVWIGDPVVVKDDNFAAGLKVKHEAWREDWYEQDDKHVVVLLPSHVEGLGNVLVTAARAGLPVVAGSGALGVADAVVEGVTGSLAEIDTVDAFVEAVLRASRLTIPPGIEGWLATFSERAVAARLARLLTEEDPLQDDQPNQVSSTPRVTPQGAQNA